MVSSHTNIRLYKLCNLFFYQFQIQIPTILKKMFNCKKWAATCNILVVLIILEILYQICILIPVIDLQKSRAITIDTFILIISVMELYSILKKNHLQTKFWLAINFFRVLNQGFWLVMFMLFDVTIGKSSESMASFGKHVG